MLSNDLGIELLVGSVKEGKMDPRDLDIIEVTDRYLQKIDTMEHRNLTISGRLFFYASVLLRLKAEYTAKGYLNLRLREGDDAPVDDAMEYEELEADLLGEAAVAAQDEQLRLPGMVVVPRPAGTRRRGLSLGDLIAALQRCDDLERRRERARRNQGRDTAQQREVVETAHEDDLGGDIGFLRTKVGGFSWESQDSRVPFEQLICEHLSPTTAYMALLFLASNSEVELHQQSFYRDLSVSRGRELPCELVA